MSSQEPWKVDDYRTQRGGRPVKEFLNGLSKAAKPKAYAAIAMLEEHGNQLLMPHSRAMGSGLYELRIAHQEGPFRIVLLCTTSGVRGAPNVSSAIPR